MKKCEEKKKKNASCAQLGENFELDRKKKSGIVTLVDERHFS